MTYNAREITGFAENSMQTEYFLTKFETLFPPTLRKNTSVIWNHMCFHKFLPKRNIPLTIPCGVKG